MMEIEEFSKKKEENEIFTTFLNEKICLFKGVILDVLDVIDLWYTYFQIANIRVLFL